MVIRLRPCMISSTPPPAKAVDDAVVAFFFVIIVSLYNNASEGSRLTRLELHPRFRGGKYFE